MLGTGPVRPVLGSDGVLQYVPPGPSNGFDGSQWGGNKVLWAVSPNARGSVVIRGHPLDGPGGVRFGLDKLPDTELVLPAPPATGAQGVARSDWRGFPSETRLQGPGCYVYDIMTGSGSDTVVFIAR